MLEIDQLEKVDFSPKNDLMMVKNTIINEMQFTVMTLEYFPA